MDKRSLTLAGAVNLNADEWVRVSVPDGFILRQKAGEWLDTGWRVNTVTDELEECVDGVYESRGFVYYEETGELAPLDNFVGTTLQGQVASQVDDGEESVRPAESESTAQQIPKSRRVSDLWLRKQDDKRWDVQKWIMKPSSMFLIMAWLLIIFSTIAYVFLTPGNLMHSTGKWAVWLLIFPVIILLWRKSGIHAASIVVVAALLGRGYHYQHAFVDSKNLVINVDLPNHTSPTSYPSPDRIPVLPAIQETAAFAENQPFSTSPDGKYTVEIFNDSQQGRMLLVKERGEHLFEQPAMGYLLDVHWSPAGSFLAVNERRGNSGDYIWILDLQGQNVLKRPDDSIWRSMESSCVQVLHARAIEKWGDGVQGDRNWGTGTRWENENTLVTSVKVLFLNASIAVGEDPILKTEIKLSVNSKRVSLMEEIQTTTSDIGQGDTKSDPHALETVPAIAPPDLPPNISVYDGNVGRLAARFDLKWHSDRTVSGTYWYPNRNPEVKYELKGENPNEGELLLNEFTNGVLSARLRLFKDSGVNGVIWNGRMHNTDGREFDVSMTRTHAKSPTDPSVVGNIHISPEVRTFSKILGQLWAGKELEAKGLDDLSPWELKILRNAIFARHGRTFESGKLSGFFHGYPTYKEDPGYNDRRITPSDRTNVDSIKAAETRSRRPSPDTPWNALRGFLDALAVGDVEFIASLLHPSRPVEYVMFTLDDPPQVAYTNKLSGNSKELKNLCLDEVGNGESYSFMMAALWDLTLSAKHTGAGMFRNEGSYLEVGFTEISGKWWLTRVAYTAP